MNRIAIVLSTLGLLLAGAALLPARAEPQPATRPDASVGVDSLDWMAGTWVRSGPGEDLEETWSAPLGDCLLGMFRWIKRDEVYLYELMSVEEDEELGLVFRLRHFHDELVPWDSEKDEPMTYPLHSLGDDEVIFESLESDAPRRFVYRRKGDKFFVSLEPPEGEPWVFEYDRKVDG